MLYVIIPLVILIIILVIMLFALLTAYYQPKPHPEHPHFIPAGSQYRTQRDHMLRLIDDMLAVPCEQVSIVNREGMTLYARYYHVADGASLDIEFHGYRGSALRDFCGGNPIARRAGRNVLLVDQRAHGKSDGVMITFGVKERYDLLDWVNYAISRFGSDVQIILSGVSMGAATVLMATELPLPPNVKGVIADCPYSSPEKIIRKVGKDMRLPMSLFYPVVRLGARLFGGFDPNSASAEVAVRSAKIPILLIHGDDDRFVPCYMSHEIRDNCASPVTFLEVHGAGHALSFIIDEKAYVRATNEFAQSLFSINS